MKEYRGEIYDAMYAHIKDDVPFYEEYARPVGEVLEIAIGTGRVGLELAKAGIKVGGIDIDKSMLRQAKKKLALLPKDVQARVTLEEGDMKELALGREFELVIVPFRAFQHMLTPKEQKQSLGYFREHLTDRGKLIIDLFDPQYEYLSEESTVNIRGPIVSKIQEFVYPRTGNKMIVTGFRKNNPTAQTFVEIWKYEEITPEGKIASQWYEDLELRWTFRYEMQYLLESCGFEILDFYGDFQKGPFKYGKEQIWVVKKR